MLAAVFPHVKSRPMRGCSALTCVVAMLSIAWNDIGPIGIVRRSGADDAERCGRRCAPRYGGPSAARGIEARHSVRAMAAGPADSGGARPVGGVRHGAKHHPAGAENSPG